jgi:hypothetical protein
LFSCVKARGRFEKQFIGNWEFLLVVARGGGLIVDGGGGLIVANGRGCESEPFPELVTERADAFKAEELTDISDGILLVLQPIEGFLEPLFHQVLVGSGVENLFEVGEKVKFVEARCGGHLIERYFGSQVIVDPFPGKIQSSV